MKEEIIKYVKSAPVLEKTFRLLNRKKTVNDPSDKMIIGEDNIINVNESSTLNNCFFDIVGNKNQIEIQGSAIFNNVKFYIRGNNNKIKIEENVRFNRGGSIWIEDYNCEAIIGKDTSFQDVHIAVTEPNSKIIIGSDCLFAYDIDIRTGDSHSIIDTITNERVNHAMDVIIGNHVWVASHVSILKGSYISDNSVIATRAVVTKRFEDPNILIGGIPARKIKSNINWNRKRIYTTTESDFIGEPIV